MFRSLRNYVASIAAALTLALLPAAVVLVPGSASAAADIKTCLSQGTGLTAGTGDTCTAAADQGNAGAKFNSILTTVVNIFSIVVGIIAVIMIIYGGARYITSGGDSGNIGNAKNTIVYAVIGLVVVALAQFIVQFVLNKVSSNA